MTLQEKLKEIKHDLSESNWVDGQLDLDDIYWLVARVEQLEGALREISKEFGTDHCDGNCLLAYETLNTGLEPE